MISGQAFFIEKLEEALLWEIFYLCFYLYIIENNQWVR